MTGVSTQEFSEGSMFPKYGVFRKACHSGGSVRPLTETARTNDPVGLEFWLGLAAIVLRVWTHGSPAGVVRGARVESELGPGGRGRWCRLEASLASDDCPVAANDLREDHLQQAVRDFKNSDRIQLLPGNLVELDPAGTGLFDLVVACEIVEHVAHTVDFLRQLGRFVAPGGHVTPNGSYFRNTCPPTRMSETSPRWRV